MRIDNNIINKKRFQVPSNYFENIDSNTFKNFNLKPNGFLVPDSYFQSIDKQQIFNRIYISKIRFLKNNFIRYGSMAAIFIGFFFIKNLEKTNNNINSSDVINYINDDLIALDDFEFSEILDSNDLSYENLVSNNDIENYFIESSLNLENLIFE
jgi:hypothetical protein